MVLAFIRYAAWAARVITAASFGNAGTASSARLVGGVTGIAAGMSSRVACADRRGAPRVTVRVGTAAVGGGRISASCALSLATQRLTRVLAVGVSQAERASARGGVAHVAAGVARAIGVGRASGT